jgi:heme exporter protein C
MKSRKIMAIFFSVLILMIPLDFFLIFKVAPTEKIMGDVQKIFYIHLPLAFSSYLGFVFICH